METDISLFSRSMEVKGNYMMLTELTHNERKLIRMIKIAEEMKYNSCPWPEKSRGKWFFCLGKQDMRLLRKVSRPSSRDMNGLL